MTDFVLTPLKYLSTARVTSGVGLPAEHDNPDWPRYIRTTDIAGPRKLRDDVWYSQPPDLLREAGVQKNDLLLTNAGSVGTAYLHVEDTPAVYAGYLTRVRPDPHKVEPGYLAYFAESRPYWDQVTVGATRSTIDNFSSGKFQNLLVPVPALEVQRRIVDYLDFEAGRIDALIKHGLRAERLVWERYLAAVEVEVDNADRRFGNSALRYAVERVMSGVDFAAADLREEPSEETYRYVRTTDIRSPDELNTEGAVHVPRSWVPRDCVAVAGDLLLSRAGSVGTAYRHRGDPVAFAGYLVGVRPARATSAWLTMFVESRTYWDQVAIGTVRSTIDNFSGSKYAALRVPLPPVEHQVQTAERLHGLRAAAHEAATAMSRQRDLLRERRRALITAVVTGELEV